MIRRRQKTPSAAASEIFGPRSPDTDVDRLEQSLKSRLRGLATHLGSEAKARRALLDSAANPRDRAVYEALLKKKGPGRHHVDSTKLADIRLLSLFQVWQSTKAKPNDRKFARFYHRRETGKSANDRDIRRIVQSLARARERMSR
jgi:hypothetical protein